MVDHIKAQETAVLTVYWKRELASANKAMLLCLHYGIDTNGDLLALCKQIKQRLNELQPKE